MKKAFIFIIAMLLSTSFVAQAETSGSSFAKPHAVTIELLGRAITYSINYDYSFSDSATAGIGLSFLSATGTSNNNSTSVTYSLLILPTYFNYYFQPGPHRGFLTGGLDLILGSATVTDASNSSKFSGSGFGVAPTLGGGYEFRNDGGFLFRIAPYLIIARQVNVWIGLSFGLTF